MTHRQNFVEQPPDEIARSKRLQAALSEINERMAVKFGFGAIKG